MEVPGKPAEHDFEVTIMRDRLTLLVTKLGLITAATVIGTSPWPLRADTAMPHPQVVEGTVHFSLYRNYLILARGAAGPLHSLTFLVDTGSSTTILDPHVARKLHVEQRPASLRVVGGHAVAMQAIVPNLSFGPIHRTDCPVLVADLSFLQNASPVQIDGILGLDVLGQTPFVIDYRSQWIHFGPLPALPDAIALTIRDGLASVEAAVNGVPARLLVDTGAASLTMFVSTTGHSAARRTVSATPSSAGKVGEFAFQRLALHSLRVGVTEFGGQSFSMAPTNDPPAAAFDGLLSPAAMGLRQLAIDMGRGEMAFTGPGKGVLVH